MKNLTLKKYLLAGAAVISFSSYAGAFDKTIKMGGTIEVQGIHYQNNGEKDQKKLSTHQKNYGMYSAGNFYVDYAMVSDEEIKYGSKIGLQQTSRNNRGTPLTIYVETPNYGKLEAGSSKTAGEQMKITGYKVACATGGGWDTYAITSTTINSKKVPYATNFCSFLDAKTRTSKLSNYSRKITYFTPNLGTEDHEVKLGISYVPDTSNNGNGKIDAFNIHSPISSSDYKFALKDGISYAISYEGKWSDLLSVKVAFANELGKPIAFDKNNDDKKSDKKFKDLNSYTVGTEITYDKLSFSASYMDYNKSLTNTEIDTMGRDTYIYSAGLKYKFADDKYAASISHFHSNNKKNKLDATSLGIDYYIASGIKAYAELTPYSTSGRFIEGNVVTKTDKTKGTVFIIGGKLGF